jgi:hypothetical protein
MGQKLVKLYEFAEKTGGAMARMRVAMLTGVPSTKAADAPDSPENLDKFKAAIKEATGQDAPSV